MVPSIIFGVVFLGFLAAFLMTARINPDHRWQALDGSVIIVWFGLLFINFMSPEAIFKLVPQVSPIVFSTMVPGLPMIWGVIISLRRFSSDVPWRQAFLYNPSLIAAVLITSFFFLNAFGVLRGDLFIYVCSIAMAGMGLLVIAAMFWRKKNPEYPNLYKKIMNQPESAQKTAVKYPPAAGGIEVKSLEEILSGHKELLSKIDLTTETEVFEKKYWPAIERYAHLVHLLPASENDHHRDAGGLLHHGLEVGYYTMALARAGMYGREYGVNKREGRERWLFACFMAGLCHDLGKIADDIRVSADGGLIWSPDSATLTDWAAKHGLTRYYADWQPNRHKVHENLTLAMLGRVLTDNDRQYISELDTQLSKQIMLALMPSNGADAPSIRPYNIRGMLQEADSRSVKEDKQKSRTPADLGLERPTPMVRHCHDGMQRLFQTGKWRINEPGAAAWVIGPAKDLYLVWPRCGVELYDSLKDEGVRGAPSAPEVIADIMAGSDLLMAAPEGGFYWRIKPADMEGPALTVLRINPKFAPNLVNPLPSGLSGMVQTDEGESSWTYVEAGSLESPSGKIIPLHPNSETAMEKAGLDRVVGDDRNVPDNHGPEAEIAPMTTRRGPISPPAGYVQPCPNKNPTGKGNFWRTLTMAAACLCLGFFGSLGYMLYLGHDLNPELPFQFYLHAAINEMFVGGYMLWLGFIALMGVISMYLYPKWKYEVRETERQVAGIKQEAQENLDNAKQETIEIVAEAQREAGEIKKTAKEEAADIRVAAKEETAEIREQAKQEGAQEKEAIIKQAEAEAAEILESAQRDAQGKKDQAKQYMDLLWSALESKAIKEGVPPEKLHEMVKAKNKADKEAVEIKARAEIQAKEAGETIIAEAKAQAQAEAAEIISQIQAKADKDAEEYVRKMKMEAIDILDDARAEAAKIRQGQSQGTQEDGEIAVEVQEQDAPQSQEGRHDQEDLPQEKISSEGNMEAEADDLKNIDAFINDRCVLGAEISTKASDLYEAYIDWAEENGVQNPVSQTSFAGILRGRGFVRVKTNKANIWRGIGLRLKDGGKEQPSTLVE